MKLGELVRPCSYITLKGHMNLFSLFLSFGKFFFVADLIVLENNQFPCSHMLWKRIRWSEGRAEGSFSVTCHLFEIFPARMTWLEFASTGCLIARKSSSVFITG